MRATWRTMTLGLALFASACSASPGVSQPSIANNHAPTSHAPSLDNSTPSGATQSASPTENDDEMLAQNLLLEYTDLEPSFKVAFTAAHTLLTRQCMQGFGFSYDVPQPTEEQIRAGQRNAGRRAYGPTDEKVAMTWGFLPDPGPTKPPQPSEKPINQAELDAEHRALFGTDRTGKPLPQSQMNGIPEGGCSGAADRKLYGTKDGNLPPALEWVNDQRIQSFYRALSTPASVAAIAEWRTCMAGKGYTRTSPLADDETVAHNPKPDPATGKDWGPAPESDIREALADIACKRQTKLVPKLSAEGTRLAKELIDANPTKFAEAAKEKHEILKRSEQVTSKE